MEFDGEIYKSVLESLPVGVYLVDASRRILSWNRGAERLTGYLSQEVIGRCCAVDLLMHCDDSKTILCGDACPLLATMRDGQVREADVYLLHKDGQRIPVRIYAFPLRNDDGVLIGCAECFEPRVILPAAMVPQDLPASIPLDSLTDLPDRAGTLAWLAGALRDFEQTEARFGVLKIAIDEMDCLLRKDGRNAVDAVLYATGRTLRANIGPADLVGRWSADSFMVVLAGCTAAALARAARRFNWLTGSEAIPWWGDRLSVAVSMGGTIARRGDTAESLAERAGEALAMRRANGGSEVLVI
jgi:PAS domain S-box-containing protein/diguanylate cyclase (GGDEF)-like protein